MATVRYAPLAELDLDKIALYTKHEWGQAQADRYLELLELGCENLAENPFFGRPHRGTRSGLRRSEIGSHVIFYVPEGDGILIGRILHKHMLPAKHGF